MSAAAGPDLIQNGLVLCLDAGNRKSYSGSGTIWKDLSGNNNNGTLTNGPTFSSANSGSIVFDGVDDYINIPSTTLLKPSEFSLDTWFRPTNFSSYNVIVVKPQNGPIWSPPYLSYMIRINNNGNQLECSTNNGTFSYFLTNFTFKVNTIYNVSFTYNSINGSVIVYMNGKILNTTTFTSGAILYSDAPVLIGGGYGNSPIGELFYGNIYNIKIYNRVLSSAEILQNYNATKGRFQLT